MFNPKTFFGLNSIRYVYNIQTPKFYSSNKKEEVNKMTAFPVYLPYTTQEPEKPPIPH